MEAAQAATEPAEASTPAADLSTEPGEASAPLDLGQPDSVAVESVVAGDLTGGEGKSDTQDTAGSDPETAPAPTEGEAEALVPDTPAVLDVILTQARETQEPRVLGADMVAPERRWFTVMDPVSLDGEDFAIGDDVAVTENAHADLRKAGVIFQPWEDGTPAR
ncbi:hypothetical protein [Paracoccus denitrificans]|uniref:hypothetical protein n=1 Tax=Paracoccus denitrificans TaxID=266 RepID=UPI003364B85A